MVQIKGTNAYLQNSGHGWNAVMVKKESLEAAWASLLPACLLPPTSYLLPPTSYLLSPISSLLPPTSYLPYSVS